MFSNYLFLKELAGVEKTLSLGLEKLFKYNQPHTLMCKAHNRYAPLKKRCVDKRYFWQNMKLEKKKKIITNNCDEPHVKKLLMNIF